MARKQNLLTWKLLPLVLFPLIQVLGVKYYFIPFIQGTEGFFAAACPKDSNASSGSPNRLAYTSVKAIDHQLCILVSFFEGALHPSTLPLLVEFLANWTPLAVFPFVEAARSNRSFLLGFPVLLGLVYQNASVALTMPIYWLVFILSGHSTTGPSAGNKILNADALAILFALFVGYLIPSAAMFLTLTDPYITAIWQAFPLWMGIAQRFHLALIRRRSSQRGAQSGYGITQLIYSLSFVISVAAHAFVLYPRLDIDNLAETDWASLRYIFVPSAPLTKTNHSLELLQWDSWTSFGSSMIAVLWLGRTPLQVIGLALWQIIAFVALGPGAALSVVFMWREAKIAG